MKYLIDAALLCEKVILEALIRNAAQAGGYILKEHRY